MACSVYTDKNLISTERTVGYFHNTSILNLILTEKQCYLIFPRWPLMKNLIISYHLSCTMVPLSKHFRMWSFLADILHCYQIQDFSACALRQPKLLGHLSLMQTIIILSVMFQRIIVCVWPSTTIIMLSLSRKKLGSFLLRTPTDQAQFYQGCLTK